jgi:GNAT superfamily N-acetyltransferase
VPAVQAPAERGVLKVPGRGTRLPAPSADRLWASRVGHDQRTRGVSRRRACRLVRRRATHRIRGLLRVYKVPWEGRDEDKTDETVWAVTCFLIRAGYRRQGISYALARGAVGFARQRGARALEAYPMITTPGTDVMWEEIHVGSRSVFEAAGLTQVHHPTKRRVVMRIDF